MRLHAEDSCQPCVRADTSFRYGTIRSALTWYLGKDYAKLLPAYTIGKGESTLYEVRMRVFKHDSRDLEAAVMNMHISNPARDDVLESDDWSNLSTVPPLDGDAHVEDDLLILMSGTLEQNRQEEEQAKNKSVQERKTKRKCASRDSECVTLLSRPHYQQKQDQTETNFPRGNWAHIAPRPVSSLEQILNGALPKVLPLAIKIAKEESNIQNPRVTRESVKAREPSLKALSAYKNTALGCRLPKITEASSLLISKLIPQPNGIPWSELRQTILLPGNLGSTPSGDKLGNTALHYHASQELFIDRLCNVINFNHWQEDRDDIPRLNDANQSWLFTMNPKHLNYSTWRLRQLIDVCGSGTPWSFHSKLEACSACVSPSCAKNAPPLALQDCHGQTWMHQYLYHNQWSQQQFYERTETGNSRAVELLTLCKDYGMDPGVKDNMGRNVLDLLVPYTRYEGNEDLDFETEGTIFEIRDLETDLSEHTLASWGIRTASRVKSWTGWLYKAASQSDKPLCGIDSALACVEAGTGLEDLDYYDNHGETLLLAFIDFMTVPDFMTGLDFGFVDPQTMPAQRVQETLRRILARIPRVDFRNRDGLTPLHLAVDLALPHVVATLLHHINTHHGFAGSTSASPDVALQNAITVESYQGVSLLQSLRATYWHARRSTYEVSIFVEADAIICACLVTNALAGKMFDESHEFRPLRERYVFESKKRTCDAQSC
jgi:hypothetical protein